MYLEEQVFGYGSGRKSSFEKEIKGRTHSSLYLQKKVQRRGSLEILETHKNLEYEKN